MALVRHDGKLVSLECPQLSYWLTGTIFFFLLVLLHHLWIIFSVPGTGLEHPPPHLQHAPHTLSHFNLDSPAGIFFFYPDFYLNLGSERLKKNLLKAEQGLEFRMF